MAASAGFKADLLGAIPNLRAFAVSLTHNSDRADDLVQETLVKAWDKQASFQPGTNLKAWLFTILRNEFYSQIRKRGREVQDTDGAMTKRRRSAVAPWARSRAVSAAHAAVYRRFSALPANRTTDPTRFPCRC